MIDNNYVKDTYLKQLPLSSDMVISDPLFQPLPIDMVMNDPLFYNLAWQSSWKQNDPMLDLDMAVRQQELAPIETGLGKE